VAQSKIHDVFEKNFQISFVPILGTIISKSPLESPAKITPNIYNVDIGGYLL
jgi:hypothetical protein